MMPSYISLSFIMRRLHIEKLLGVVQGPLNELVSQAGCRVWWWRRVLRDR